MKKFLCLFALLFVGCEGTPTAPEASITVTWPAAGNEYLINDGIRIRWETVGDVGPVDILIRPADRQFPQIHLFFGVGGGEVLWRSWWTKHASIKTGHYVFLVGTPNRVPFVNAISPVFYLNREACRNDCPL